MGMKSDLNFIEQEQECVLCNSIIQCVLYKCTNGAGSRFECAENFGESSSNGSTKFLAQLFSPKDGGERCQLLCYIHLSCSNFSVFEIDLG